MKGHALIRLIDPFASLSVLIPFSVYLLTLAPTVTFFDSGEFLTAIYSLGLAHSPGYPLFINYAKPFTFLPFGSIAFRVNIATALSAAVACYGVYLLVSHILAGEELSDSGARAHFWNKFVALCAALTFAFTPRLWLQSNHDKPYPLIAFLSAMVFYLLILWRERYREGDERPAYVYIGAFLCGLAFGAHQTMVLMLPSYAVLIVAMDWRLLTRIKEILLAIAFALFGFAVHLHLPIRAAQSPLLNWGDPRTLDQFLWNFLRKGYPVEKPARDLALFWQQVNAFSVPYEFTLAGFILLFIGIATYLKKLRHEIAAYGVGILVFLAVIVGYFNTPSDLIFLTEEFFDPLYLLSAVFIGLGFFSLLKLVLVFLSPELVRALPVKAVFALSLLALPVSVCALNYVENDQHENYIAYDYATNTLRTLAQGAVIYTWGDSGAFPLWYLQGVERMREDVDLLHTPHLVFTWYLDAFPHLFQHSMLRSIPLENQPPENVMKLSVAEQMALRPVFIDFSTRYSIDFSEYTLMQKGICYQLEKGGGGAVGLPDRFVWNLYNTRGLSGEMFFRDLDTGKAILIYANSHMEAGETFLRLGRRLEGVAEMRAAEMIAPELSGQITLILRKFGVK